MKRIAIVGGGIAGLTAAYHLAKAARAGAALDVHLFEAGGRLGGTVETVREGGFVVECGPDGWVTEKPWARDLALELGLEDQLIPSLDAGRKTYLYLEGSLVAMPDGMRMMVPADLPAVEASPLFTAEAKRAFREEPARAEALRAQAPDHDESIAAFVERHFGPEVLTRVAAPLLSGVFGGDVAKLSVRAVMPGFVQMERRHGSLILGLQAALQGRSAVVSAPTRTSPEAVLLDALAPAAPAIFTSLRGGVGQLIERMTAAIPPGWLHLREPVRALTRTAAGWTVATPARTGLFDAVLLAAPIDAAQALLRPTDPEAADLMQMDATSSVIAAFCFPTPLDLPPGFGFLVPPGPQSRLLACTFTPQKFPHRVPPGAGMLRAFFGSAAAGRMIESTNDEIAAIARHELARILGPLPDPILTVIRRWPRSLPQYAVGHLDRMAALDARIRAHGTLWLLGNGYRGVGLPDLIRDARAAAQAVLPSSVR